MAWAVELTCPGTMDRNTNTEQPAPLQDTPDRALAKGRAFEVLLVVEVAGKHLGINGQAKGLRPQSRGWGKDGKGTQEFTHLETEYRAWPSKALGNGFSSRTGCILWGGPV